MSLRKKSLSGVFIPQSSKCDQEISFKFRKEFFGSKKKILKKPRFYFKAVDDEYPNVLKNNYYVLKKQFNEITKQNEFLENPEIVDIKRSE